jgi:hypothetical protein
MVKKKSSKKSVKAKTKKQEVCEVFEVGKEGHEKLVKTCGQEEVKIATKDQIAHQNRLLRNILLIIGIIVVGFVLVLLVLYSMNNFEYNGVKYNVLKEGDITFYHTDFQSRFVKPGITVRYNVYLRNDPRELKNIPFEGNLAMLEMAVIDSKENFDCEGDGAIAIANFNQIMKAMGTEVIRDPEASCDSSGRYMFFDLKSGEETKIVQTGPACYDFIIKDCEVILATERFLIETSIV